jgi:hypothetical protein
MPVEESWKDGIGTSLLIQRLKENLTQVEVRCLPFYRQPLP